MMKIKNILKYLWQIPQNLLGLLLFAIYSGETISAKDLKYVSEKLASNVDIRFSKKMNGGISLGKHVIVSKNAKELTVQHELGHCKQSLMLGPLYLLVIGLPSLLHASMGVSPSMYYRFYTESWADKLAGIKR